jgi:uncharacterized protein (DUF2237 family)
MYGIYGLGRQPKTNICPHATDGQFNFCGAKLRQINAKLILRASSKIDKWRLLKAFDSTDVTASRWCQDTAATRGALEATFAPQHVDKNDRCRALRVVTLDNVRTSS